MIFNLCSQKEEEAIKKKAQLLHEHEIASQRAQRLREVYHEKKIRQQVRENNQDLRTLESQLRTAYVSKALAAQIKDREALQLAEEIQRKQDCKAIEEARLTHLEEMRHKDEIERERKKQLHEDLTQQIVTAHKQHQKLYEDFLQEKYYLDEIAQKVKEELLDQAQKKIERKEKTKKEMDAFKAIKTELERIKKVETAEENQRIIEYIQKRDLKIEEDEKRQKDLEKNRKYLNEIMVVELSELAVSLKLLYFVGKCRKESVNVLLIRKAMPEAFEHHRVFKHCFGVVFE